MENWTRYVDGYCERLEPGFWGEPLNAVTNLAFIAAALFVWQRSKQFRKSVVSVLAVLLALIGVGSFLLHTFAAAWAGSLDVLSIALFVLVYLYAANRHFLGLSIAPALGVTALIFPYVPAMTWTILKIFPAFGFNAAYLSIDLLIFAYAAILWKRMPDIARGLFAGAALLCVSIAFRAVDEPFCEFNPFGTHTIWHVLNGVILGLMAMVMQRRLATTSAISGDGRQN